MSHPSPWDIYPAMIERLKELHAQKNPEFSFADIAHMLCREFCVHVTRNACIAKAHRIHLPDRAFKGNSTDRRYRGGSKGRKRKATVHRFTTRQAPRTQAGILKYKRQVYLLELFGDQLRDLTDDSYRPEADRVDLMQLNKLTCRWPYGEGRETMFCGAVVVESHQSYCPYHAHIAYRAEPVREAAE